MMSRSTCLYLALPYLLVLFGCGCGASDGARSPTGVDDGKEDSTELGSLSQEQIEQVYEGVRNLVAEKSNAVVNNELSLDDFLLQLTDFLKNQPAVQEAGYEGTEEGKDIHLVYAVFKNGLQFFIPVSESHLDNPPDDQTPDANNGPAGTLGSSTHPLVSSEIPSFADNMVFLDPEPKFVPNGMFYSQLATNYNYANVAYGGPSDPLLGSVEFFKTLHRYQFVYINSHGFYSKKYNLYSLKTNEQRTRAKDSKYFQDGDLQAGRVVIGENVIRYKRQLYVGTGPIYWVSSKFFYKYLGRFKRDSVVIADTCNSAFGFGLGEGAHPGDENGFVPGTSLPATLMSKGVGVMYGWTWRVRIGFSNFLHDYLFDRMFGLNITAPEAVPNVPYPLSTAFQKAEEKKYTFDPAYQAYYQEIPFGERYEYMFRPSLDSVWIDRGEKSLNIQGNIGSKGGEVCFSDKCQKIAPGENWSDGAVKVALPADPTGPLSIKIDSHASNTVVMNEWTGTATLQSTSSNTCQLTGKVQLKLRCELSGKRADLDGPVGKPACSLALADDINYEFTIGGEHVDDGITVKCEGASKGTGGDVDTSYASIDMQGDSRIQINFPVAGTLKMIGRNGQVLKEDPLNLFAVLNGKLTVSADGMIQAGSSDPYSILEFVYPSKQVWTWDACRVSHCCTIASRERRPEGAMDGGARQGLQPSIAPPPSPSWADAFIV